MSTPSLRQLEQRDNFVSRHIASDGAGYDLREEADMLAAVGAGAFKNVAEACGATIKVVSETSVQRAQQREYDRRFPLFQDLYQSLAPRFKPPARLSS